MTSTRLSAHAQDDFRKKMAQQLSAEEFSRLQSQLIELRTENYQLREKGSKLEAEVNNLRTRVSTQDREIQLKRVTSLLPIGKSSKKQKQDFEARLEENDALYKKVETLEGEHRQQQATLMLELSNVHDELDKMRKERDELAASASSDTGAQSTLSALASAAEEADDSALRHLQAENAVLQKTLAATRESMQAQIAGLQKQICGDNADGVPLSALSSIGVTDGLTSSAEAADLQMKLDTAEEEKRMLQDRLEKQAARHEESLVKCQEEATKWSEKARKKQDSLRQMQEEMDTLMREKETTLAAMRSSHEDELQRVMQQSARMQEELGNANEELISLRDAESGLRSQIASSTSSSSRTEAEQKRTIDELRQEGARLQEDLNTSISSKQQLVKGQVEELENSMAELQDRIYQLEKERNQALEALDEANKVADKRKLLLDTMAIENQNHADEVQKKLSEQSAAYEDRLEGAAQQIAELKGCATRLAEYEEELKAFGSVRGKLEHEEEERARLERELEEERDKLKSETDRLEAEVTEARDAAQQKEDEIDELRQAVADAEGKIKITERKSNSQMKDIRRQLELERKRSERLQVALSSEGGTTVGLAATSGASVGTPEAQKKNRTFEGLFDGLTGDSSSGHGFSFRHRTNSNETLSNSGESASLGGSEDVGTLLSRITLLQKEKWLLEERVSHLEQNAASLVEDVLQKSAIIKSNMMEPKADQMPTSPSRSASGGPVTSTPSRLAPQLLRKLTSPLHRSGGSDTRGTTPSETGRLQRVVEETLIKNLSLQQNIDTLAEELSRVQAEKEVLEEKLVQG